MGTARNITHLEAHLQLCFSRIPKRLETCGPEMYGAGSFANLWLHNIVLHDHILCSSASALLELLSAANGRVDMSHKPCAVTPVLPTVVLISRPEEAPHQCLWVSARRSAGKICSNGHTVHCFMYGQICVNAAQSCSCLSHFS